MGSPRILQQMLLVHEDPILRPAFQVHLHRQPLDGHPASALLAQPDQCHFPVVELFPADSCSALTVLSAFLGFFHWLPSSSFLLTISALVLQASVLPSRAPVPGQLRRPSRQLLSCCWCVLTHVCSWCSHGRERKEGGRKEGRESVTPVKDWAPCCIVT